MYRHLREVYCNSDSITVVEKNCVAMLSAAATGVYRRGNVASDVAEHSGSIKRDRLFQSGTARVASTNLVPIGVSWHFSGFGVYQALAQSPAENLVRSRLLFNCANPKIPASGVL